MNTTVRITRRELDAMNPAERERTITALCRRLPLGARLYCAALDVFARGMENLAQAVERRRDRCVPQRYGSMHRLRVYAVGGSNPVRIIGYEVSCECGWSRARHTREEAQEDANEHAAALR